MADILKSITAPIKLSTGSTDLIKAVQKELVRLGYPLVIDGIAGAKTIAAFHQFKTDNFLGDLDTLGATTAAKLLGGKPELLVTEYEAESVFGRQITLQQLADLNNCLHRFDIVTPKRIQMFLSQIGAESGGLQWMCEIASGRAYEGRRDLGNIHPGDGVKYKGAGALQVTGRANYQALANYLKDARVTSEGCAYVAAHIPFTASGHWWMTNRMNALIDKGATIEQVSAKVNGKHPANHLAERIKYYNRACKVIN